jgi:hypothetical protein
MGLDRRLIKSFEASVGIVFVNMRYATLTLTFLEDEDLQLKILETNIICTRSYTLCFAR